MGQYNYKSDNKKGGAPKAEGNRGLRRRPDRSGENLPSAEPPSERLDELDQTGDTGAVFGKNSVTELLRGGAAVDTLYLSQELDPGQAAYFSALAAQKGAVIKTLHPQKLARLCGSDRHQGVAAVGRLVDYGDVAELLAIAAQRGEPPFIVLLDGIEDPHNLGAIIRTAECAGMQGVVIPKRGGCAVTPAVFRASAGACGHIAIARVPNLAAAVRELKSAGVFCYCADMDGEDCASVDMTGPAAMVVGSEGRGVSRLVKELCDRTVSLPILGQVGSLNASVAAGAVIYEALRQRRGAGGKK